MAHSDFSWTKILSFLGAAVLFFIAFVSLSTGIGLIVNGYAFNGIVVTLAGASAIALGVVIYRYYVNWSNNQNSSIK